MKLYRAVVEDNKDPLEIGRVRVRIFGLHTPNNENSSEKFNYIKTDDLPWAEVMGGTDLGLISGVGISSVLKQGTWVWCILDQDDPNKPIVIGTIIGISKNRPKYSEGEGFNDRDEIYPYNSRLEESDINRLARGVKLSEPYYDKPNSVYSNTDTIHKKINDNLDIQNVSDPVSGADVSQSEPESTSNLTKYPNATVFETPSGHIFEFDDTPGNELIRLYHTSGSYIEIKPDGSFVLKSANSSGTDHFIHMSDVQEHIAKNVKKYIEQNFDEIIEGAVKRKIGGSLSEHIVGNVTLKVDGNLTYDVTGTVNFVSGGNMNINTNSNLSINTAGSQTVTNGGNHTINAARIDLN